MQSQPQIKKEISGRWTKAEHNKFIKALEKYGRDWVKVQRKIKTRTLLQIRSHAQKVFLNMSENDIIAFIGSDDESESSAPKIKTNHKEKIVSTRKKIPEGAEKELENNERKPNLMNKHSVSMNKVDEEEQKRNSCTSEGNNVEFPFFLKISGRETEAEIFEIPDEDQTTKVVKETMFLRGINENQRLIMTDFSFPFQIWNQQLFYQPLLFPFCCE